ncbi:hypothetical protein ACRAWF_46910 [Streptomyces sp. L7]
MKDQFQDKAEELANKAKEREAGQGRERGGARGGCAQRDEMPERGQPARDETSEPGCSVKRTGWIRTTTFS